MGRVALTLVVIALAFAAGYWFRGGDHVEARRSERERPPVPLRTDQDPTTPDPAPGKEPRENDTGIRVLLHWKYAKGD